MQFLPPCDTVLDRSEGLLFPFVILLAPWPYRRRHLRVCLVGLPAPGWIPIRFSLPWNLVRWLRKVSKAFTTVGSEPFSTGEKRSSMPQRRQQASSPVSPSSSASDSVRAESGKRIYRNHGLESGRGCHEIRTRIPFWYSSSRIAPCGPSLAGSNLAASAESAPWYPLSVSKNPGTRTRDIALKSITCVITCLDSRAAVPQLSRSRRSEVDEVKLVTPTPQMH